MSAIAPGLFITYVSTSRPLLVVGVVPPRTRTGQAASIADGACQTVSTRPEPARPSPAKALVRRPCTCAKTSQASSTQSRPAHPLPPDWASFPRNPRVQCGTRATSGLSVRGFWSPLVPTHSRDRAGTGGDSRSVCGGVTLPGPSKISAASTGPYSSGGSPTRPSRPRPANAVRFDLGRMLDGDPSAVFSSPDTWSTYHGSVGPAASGDGASVNTRCQRPRRTGRCRPRRTFAGTGQLGVRTNSTNDVPEVAGQRHAGGCQTVRAWSAVLVMVLMRPTSSLSRRRKPAKVSLRRTVGGFGGGAGKVVEDSPTSGRYTTTAVAEHRPEPFAYSSNREPEHPGLDLLNLPHPNGIQSPPR